MLKIHEMPFKTTQAPIESTVGLFQKTLAEQHIGLTSLERPSLERSLGATLQKPRFSDSAQAWTKIKTPSQPQPRLSAVLTRPQAQTPALAHLQPDLNQWSADSKSVLSAARGYEALKAADRETWSQAGEFLGWDALSFLVPGGPLFASGGMVLGLGIKAAKTAKGAAPVIKPQIDIARANIKRLDSKIKDLDNEILHYQDLATQPHVKHMRQDLINHTRTLQGRLDNLIAVRAEAAKKLLDLINK